MPTDTSEKAQASALPTVEALVHRRHAEKERQEALSPTQSRPHARGRSQDSTMSVSLDRSSRASVPRGVSSVIQQTPKVLVLDLDETLIHSTLSPTPGWGLFHAQNQFSVRLTNGLLNILGLGSTIPPHARLQLRTIEVRIDGRRVCYQVYKRPWVDYFLRKVAAWYQVVIFTASMKEYADPVIDWLDGGEGLISGRLFRESCTLRNGSYLKNLEVVERDLSRVCLVDNSPMSYMLQEANGIPVEGWTHDPNDEALLDLLPMLDGLRYASDVRHILGLRGF